MIPKEFAYSEQAHYAHWSAFKVKTVNIVDQNIVVTSDGKSFQVSFPDVSEKYILPYVESDAVVQRWRTDWIRFWQNQLNFAVWCATTGCGVDFNNHLKDTGMIGSLFRFHVYYQTRRILFEMAVALPQDTSWNAFDNNYNRSAYERICKEFYVDIDWRQKQSDNQGLGRIYNYWTNIGYRPFDKGVKYDKKDYSFTQTTTNDIIHIDYIAQSAEATKAWTTFILDDSKGFTRAGVECINDSIRTYGWAILGSQSQTRTDILGTGTAFDAQKQFLANIEDAINSPVDLPSQIARYQSTLKYARSKVDFVCGTGLYMSPSNMELRIGTIQDYNNKIVIANEGEGLTLGLNDETNTVPIPPRPTATVEGTKTKQTHPELTPAKPAAKPAGHAAQAVKPAAQAVVVSLTPEYRKQVQSYADIHNLPQSWVDGISSDPARFKRWLAARDKEQHPDQPLPDEYTSSEQHENKKTTLIVGGIVLGLTALIIYEIY